MSPALFRLSTLTFALLTSNADAVGFGEIVLHSRVGEPLRAEVPVLSNAGEPIDTACFSLAALRDSDLPVVSSARTRLIHDSAGYRLLITGITPIAEPIFIIGLRANCGIELQRDYLLMPSAPLMLPESTPTATSSPHQRNLANRAGEAEPTTRQLRHQNSDAPPPKPKKQPRRDRQAGAIGNVSDRLVLGSPPEELRPNEKAIAPRGNPSEMDERMLKLETTLHLLNQEVDKLNHAMALTTEALAIQNKIQTAQASPSSDSSPTVEAAATLPSPRDISNRNNWLELLFSAVAGGAMAAGIAHFLGRRQTSRGDDKALAASGYRPETLAKEVKPSPVSGPEQPAKLPTEIDNAPPDTTVDILLEAPSANLNEGEEFEVQSGDSALELAEIMLSFGRVRGAADTLAFHIEEKSPDNIQPWSMLLDLYRRGDMRAEFDTFSERMREKFNVHVPAWEDSNTPVSGLKSLEDYAHIVWRTENSWGTQECLDYLYELVHDNRAGKRSGFALEVVEEIALLIRVLEEGYGLTRPA